MLRMLGSLVVCSRVALEAGERRQVQSHHRPLMPPLVALLSRAKVMIITLLSSATWRPDAVTPTGIN